MTRSKPWTSFQSSNRTSAYYIITRSRRIIRQWSRPRTTLQRSTLEMWHLGERKLNNDLISVVEYFRFSRGDSLLDKFVNRFRLFKGIPGHFLTFALVRSWFRKLYKLTLDHGTVHLDLNRFHKRSHDCPRWSKLLSLHATGIVQLVYLLRRLLIMTLSKWSNSHIVCGNRHSPIWSNPQQIDGTVICSNWTISAALPGHDFVHQAPRTPRPPQSPRRRSVPLMTSFQVPSRSKD